MAEFVELTLEKSLGELHNLIDINLFDKTEVLNIYQQRRNNSYSLQKKTKRKEDLLRYWKYEENLLKEIKTRRKKTGNMQRIQEIDWKIKKRLASFVRDGLERYKCDLDLWKKYFKFCKKQGLSRTANKMLYRMMQLHGDKPDLWLFACQWTDDGQLHTDDDKSDRGRMWLIRGLSAHPGNELLFKELIKLDLDMSLDPERKETALALAATSFKHAIKDVSNPKFRIELLKLVSNYPDAVELNQQALSLVEELADSEDAWEEMARMQLKENSENYKAVVAVYEKAVEMLSTEKMWRKYVDFLQENLKNLKLRDKLYQDVYPALIHEKFATEKDIARLADYRLNHETATSAQELLQTGLEMYPQSCILMYEYLRLKLTIGNENEGFKEALVKIVRLTDAPAESVARIWTMVINFMGEISTEKAEKLFKECMNGRLDVAQLLKPKYLQFRFISNGIASARELLKNPKIIFPPNLEFYKLLIEIETSLPNVDQNMSNYYETIIQAFGKTNADLWLDWISFEQTQKNYQKVTQLHARAMSTLTPSEADIFTTKYSLQF